MLRELIYKMLEHEQEKRISWEEIFSHPNIAIDLDNIGEKKEENDSDS